MVGFRRASVMFFVVLVVMATTVANGTSLGDKAKDAATTVGDKAKDAATSLGAKVPGAVPGAKASCDVKVLGAKGDGKTDDCAAFATAWKDVCAAGGTLIVPKGDYLVGSLELKGPCKGPVTLELNGNLKAPATVAATKPHAGWIEIDNVCDFTLKGNNVILDGQGALAWKVNDCAKTGKCNSLPINIRLTGLTNSKIMGITSTNSKLFHMNIINCKNLTLENIGIDAPAESLNTDGIHIGRSNGVNLIGAKIRTGDDCVSIGDGTENLIIENVECGPGHGISIGSLGLYPNEQPVRGVTVRKCLIKNTDNGVRIKTWPGSPPGIASNIIFEDITMDNVSTPVLIDQEYCPHGKCKAGVPSQVKLSDVIIKNIKGTSATKVAVKLMCSKGCPCTNISLADINLVHNGKEGPAVSACSNIKPILSGKLVPEACTEVAKPGP
ncbi:PREDICTED: exopolygalacturonase clone GBGA483-like [Camelina sativa]|uniref:Exopolygalacturonase clone GBGA483-like n=1 Tax=Camelina sativa TaxID=90675 RepID=A0ABM0VM31_CAMSA|nr:PREDICTED: exopolygalacturonase clone GBGA483-like [Camelina sativa]